MLASGLSGGLYRAKILTGLPFSPVINCSLSGVLGLNATHMGKHFCFLAHWHRLASHVGTYIQKGSPDQGSPDLYYILLQWSLQLIMRYLAGVTETARNNLQQISQDSVKRYLSGVSDLHQIPKNYIQDSLKILLRWKIYWSQLYLLSGHK